ncbi:MAG: sugar ABC transporter permease [Anaerolineaceae bacterium]|nr:sugar ABC transporter permease [Anaerolineaceae bacterium]
MRKREALWFYLLVFPWVFGFITLTLGPMIYSLFLSLTNWDLFTPPQFVGLDNFIRLFTRDKIFWKTVFNTLYYAFISVPLGMLFSLFISYFLNRPIKGSAIYRTLYYIPATVPGVASALLFRWLLAPDAGMINRFLAIFGVDGPAWLLEPDWVKPALILMSLWTVGANITLLMAGMKSIPAEFYEAAELDGASPITQYYRITLPLLTPVIFFNLINGLIGALQVFTQIYIMTGTGGANMGGPNNASMMIVPYLFNNGFRFYKMGYASAIAWILFVLVMILTLLVFRSSSAWVYYETEVRRS